MKYSTAVTSPKLKAFFERYETDICYRAEIGLYSSLTINLCYSVFRILAGILYTSVWFITMAVYYLVLGATRAYLALCYRRKNDRPDSFEKKCYKTCAWLLFLLNIPMGGMITLTVIKDHGYSYPGYTIYLTALYTFYSLISSLVNLIKYRKLGSPILSASKAISFVAGLMSVLGLQTALIAQFSQNGEEYRKLMNSLTGAGVYLGVIAVATVMLKRSHNNKL